ncbi:hypothetical protein GETHOR_13070 [Geothrix oryzae]|uniref:DNA/RNA non-specific endonuclease n=1 Tax=Geothrix oryzae TaxID=2927975 RepID=A0ABM8DQD7_9BACT|nr:hypothetical protein [Geothrix oryzae]BDU69206.1 hypothetical protein GETHOR_13070 [Geothrix oryzae]
MRMSLTPSLLRTALVCTFLPAFGGQDPDLLDKQYGTLQQPAYIKHYEADKGGKVLLNPYLQVATKDHPGILNPKHAPYNWVIDAEGRVGIIQEAAHPLGRTYEKGFYRPEDKSKRKPGTTENYGHVSALAGGMGRISGEILYDKGTNTFTVNNKSGRYSKNNADRTPEQLVNAAALIREVVDPGSATWGPVFYLLEYAPEDIREESLKRPDVAYDDAAKKSRPHLIVMPAAPATPKAAKPAAKVEEAEAKPAVAAPKAQARAPKAEPVKGKKAKKPKAANNDDPS